MRSFACLYAKFLPHTYICILLHKIDGDVSKTSDFDMLLTKGLLVIINKLSTYS